MPGTDAQPLSPPDRSSRLTLFGILALLLGFVAGLFGVLQLLLPAVTGQLGDEQVPVDWRGVLASTLTHMMIGLVFVVAGTGSIAKRRWAPPVMLIVAWTWLLTGVVLLLMAIGLMEELLAGVAAEMQMTPDARELLPFVKAFVLIVLALAGVVLPAVFVWVYQDPEMRRTCQRLDPERDWSDDAPLPVLGLSLALGGCALFSIPLALRAAVPLFGYLATGLSGGLWTLGAAFVCAWLALATYRRQRAGWWGTVAFFLVIALSSTVTFWNIDPLEILGAAGAVGLPPSSDGGVVRGTLIVTTLIVTALSLGYLAAIRRHFDR